LGLRDTIYPRMPEPTLAQSKRIELLNGLPYICLHENSIGDKVLGQLLDGTKYREMDVERVWNAALVVDTIEAPGAWLDHFATPRDTEIMIHAERLFGCQIIHALPIYLAMDKSNYSRFEARPRKCWPNVRVN
jgi:hypothetical protein